MKRPVLAGRFVLVPGLSDRSTRGRSMHCVKRSIVGATSVAIDVDTVRIAAEAAPTFRCKRQGHALTAETIRAEKRVQLAIGAGTVRIAAEAAPTFRRKCLGYALTAEDHPGISTTRYVERSDVGAALAAMI